MCIPPSLYGSIRIDDLNMMVCFPCKLPIHFNSWLGFPPWDTLYILPDRLLQSWPIALSVQWLFLCNFTTYRAL